MVILSDPPTDIEFGHSFTHGEVSVEFVILTTLGLVKKGTFGYLKVSHSG